MKTYSITESPINPEVYREWVLHPRAGAVIVFTGHVREWTQDVRTARLVYEAYTPMAEKKMAEIGDEIENQWPGTRVAIAHRVGTLEITDIAVVIAVSSPHRKAAFEASEYAIERLKAIVPIWKKDIGEEKSIWIYGGNLS